MLSLLTLNVQAAAMRRAQALLLWLDKRTEDIVILSETSAGAGTRYLLDQCRNGGLAVLKNSGVPGDRGVALVSRTPLRACPGILKGLTLPGRVVAARILGTRTTVIGVYVPSSDRAPEKLARKRDFLTSLLAALHSLPEQTRAHLVLGGDYNVIARDHQPSYRSFLPFEYALLDSLQDLGLSDAYTGRQITTQPHSWIGRTGNGYRFDYFHVGTALRERVIDCSYLHQPREQKLSDHAAVTLTLDVPSPARPSTDVSGIARAGKLF